jgi:hypothetical protein
MCKIYAYYESLMWQSVHGITSKSSENIIIKPNCNINLKKCQKNLISTYI